MSPTSTRRPPAWGDATTALADNAAVRQPRRGKLGVPRHTRGGVGEIERASRVISTAELTSVYLSSKVAPVCPQRRQRPFRGWSFPSLIRTPVREEGLDVGRLALHRCRWRRDPSGAVLEPAQLLVRSQQGDAAPRVALASAQPRDLPQPAPPPRCQAPFEK